jgi:WD40 repeat protein
MNSDTRIGRRQMLIAAGAALAGVALPRALYAQPTLKTLTPVASLGQDPNHFFDGFSTISLSHDGKRMLTSATNGNAATLWDLTTNKLITSLEFDELVGSHLVGDGKSAILASRRYKVVQREISGRYLKTIATDSKVDAVAVGPDGRAVALGIGPALSLWDMRDAGLTKARKDQNLTAVRRLAFSPDGKRLACAYETTLRVYTVPSLTPVAEWPVSISVDGLAFSADSRLLLVGEETSVTVFDVAAKRTIARIDQPGRSSFAGLAVFRNTPLFALCDRKGHFLIGSLAAKAFIARSAVPIEAERVAISPDQRLAYVGIDGGEIVVFDVSGVSSSS